MNWTQWIKQHQYPLLGALVGLLVAILLLLVGFWKTLLLVTFTLLGTLAANYLKKTGILERFFN